MYPPPSHLRRQIAKSGGDALLAGGVPSLYTCDRKEFAEKTASHWLISVTY